MIIVGFTMAYIALRKYLENRKMELLVTSILFFTLPLPWVSQVYVVLVDMMGNTATPKIGVYLATWSIAIFALSWIYITLSLYNRPAIKWVGSAFTAALGIYLMVQVYILSRYEVDYPADSVIYNVVYELDTLIVIGLLGVLGLLVVSPTYLYFSVKSQQALFKFRSLMIGIAALIYTVAAVLDALITFDTILGIASLRFLLLVSLILLYIGYLTPRRIRERYT